MFFNILQALKVLRLSSKPVCKNLFKIGKTLMSNLTGTAKNQDADFLLILIIFNFFD